MKGLSKKSITKIRTVVATALAGLLLAGLAGCGKSAPEEATTDFALPVDDSQFVLTPQESAALSSNTVSGNGAVIAVAVNAAGVESGKNAAIWNGVSQFCQNYGFSAQSFVAAEDSEQADEDVLRQAAESGASMVVCVGSDMELPLYNVQSSYPSVAYLMLDGEPHNEDYTSYQTASAAHCVLFHEEQAGFLAGYAVVMEGYTSLGFLGGEAVPEDVHYGTGFLQGAQVAAEEKNVYVSVNYWYCGDSSLNDVATDKLNGWFAEGTQLVLATDRGLVQGCSDIAYNNGGRVIGTDVDCASLSATVLTSAMKNYSRAVQTKLFSYYAAGNSWGTGEEQTNGAGFTETLGATTDMIGLPTAQWAFSRFTVDQYTALYRRISEGSLKVEVYADTGSAPDCPNLTVHYNNL